MPYAATPWPAEDGGPLRQQRPHGISGPRAGSAELVASRLAPLCVMALLGPSGEVLLLRNSIGPDGVSWVERVDPETVEEVDRSPDLALGPFWPGGMGLLDDGSIVVVQGRWAHRLGPDLSVLASRELPVDAPHNSFVLLGDGSIATKDLRRPGDVPSTLSILDPETLADRAEPLALPEPCVARLCADGDELFVVGVDTLSRWRWDAEVGRVFHAEGLDVRYRTRDDQSFGWDPVIDAGSVWWMDNGDHTFEQGLTMLGNGVAAGPVRLWRAPLDGSAEAASVEISGLAHGTVTNPPIVDPARGVAVAFDSGNGVLAAFSVEDLSPRWSVPLGASCHMVLYPDTGELLVNDHDREAGDALAVVDVATGEVGARAAVESPAQSVVFSAPGTDRDAYFVSLSTIAHVRFSD